MHAYIALDTSIPLSYMLTFTQTAFRENGIGMEIYAINQVPRGVMVAQIALMSTTTMTPDGAYKDNWSLDNMYTDDDMAYLRNDDLKAMLVREELRRRPAFPARPLVYARYLAHLVVEPFLEFSEETAQAILDDTRPVEDDTESLDEYCNRVCKRKVGDEIRKRDPTPDWDFFFKVSDDAEAGCKKARTSEPIPKAPGAVNFIEVAGGAGGSFYVAPEAAQEEEEHERSLDDYWVPTSPNDVPDSPMSDAH